MANNETHESFYNLYRKLTYSLYDPALEAVRSRDMKRTEEVYNIIQAAFEPLRTELGEKTPVYDLLEYTDLATIRNWTDDKWEWAIKRLEVTKETYPEILSYDGPKRP